MKYKLSDICSYYKKKVDISGLTEENYISTENMIPDKNGVTKATSLPTTTQTQGYGEQDVLVSNIRPYFKKIWFADRSGGCSNDVLVFRANKDVDSRFLYYVLADDTFFEYSMATSKGTKMPRGDKKALMEYEVPDYGLEYQKKIAGVLSALDEKIQMNTEINKNLLTQLRTIFQQKFTYNPHIDSYKLVPLADLCSIVTKGTTPTTLGKSFTASGINFIKAESISGNHSIDKSKFAFIDPETNGLLKRSVIHSGDMLFTIAGSLGRFAFVDDNVLPANTNQAVAIIRADVKKIPPEYLYSVFIGNWHNDYYTKRIQQAVQANLSLGTIKSLPIPILSTKEMDSYMGLIKPIVSMTKTNERENERLSQLRDSLLPRLISGQIDVSGIDI